MANGEFLTELKEYAETEGKALPARLFQRLVLQATAKLLEDSTDTRKRLEKIEQRHCDEDKVADKKDNRRWDIKLLAIANVLAILLALLGLR